MPDDPAEQPRLVECAPGELDRRCELGDRYRDVGGHRLRAGRKRERRHQRLVPRRPHLRAPRRVTLCLETDRTLVDRELARGLELGSQVEEQVR